MKSNLVTQVRQDADEAVREADQLTASWRDLPNRPIQSQTEADQINAAVKRLKVPASRTWIVGRSATLLVQYFVSSIPEEMAKAIGDDWCAELDGYPVWAIQKACRWWMSRDNPKRGRKPISGDIAERAKIEMGVVRYAEGAVRRFTPSDQPQPDHDPRHEPTAEQKNRANDIVRQAGFGIRGNVSEAAE